MSGLGWWTLDWREWGWMNTVQRRTLQSMQRCVRKVALRSAEWSQERWDTCPPSSFAEEM